MPFNGSGTFVSLPAPDFPALPGTTILASSFNANMNDIFANGLTKCLTRDGQSPPTANLPMAGFKFTGMGNGTADSDSATLGQTLALRGQVGVVDWDTRVTTGIFEATAASLLSPAANFPPTSFLGQLIVMAQGALVTQAYVTPNGTYFRQKVGGVFSSWVIIPARENFLVNSAFQIWQAGTSLGSASGRRYLADQFVNEASGTTYVPSQQQWPMGQTDVNSGAEFFHRTVVTSVAGAANYCFLQQPIESVRTCQGKQVTFSFWAKANVALSVAVQFFQFFGSGGGSASVSIPVGKVAITTSWARYSFTANVPSVSGKVLGSATDDFFAVNLWYDAGSNFNTQSSLLGQQSGTFDTWGWKLEEGPAFSPYDLPNIGEELGKCLRYYVDSSSTVSSVGALLWSGNTTNGGVYTTLAPFPTRMRVAPTMSIVSTISTSFPAAFTLVGSTTQFVSINRTANATGIGIYSNSFTASARF